MGSILKTRIFAWKNLSRKEVGEYAFAGAADQRDHYILYYLHNSCRNPCMY